MSKDRRGDAGLRAYERYPLTGQGVARCPDWEKVEEVATLNISGGGMFLRTDEPAAVGTKVQFTLELPDGRRVELGATVRHVIAPEAGASASHAAGMGVEVDTEFRNELLALVEIARIRQGRGGTSPVEDLPVLPPPDKPRRPPASLPRAQVAGVVAIDFGVTYSSLAVAVGDTVQAIAGPDGRARIPSLLFCQDGARPLVGWQAREQQEQHPEHIVSSAKRLLGQSYSNERIAGYLQSVPYRTSAGPGDSIVVECGGVSGSVPEICAAVLRHLCRMAEEQLRTTVRRAVLTHPVTFDAGQKQALARAAQLAGLEVVGMLDEPVAAALAYGMGQGKPKNEIVAVYDLGGGTFDFTVLDMSGETFRVLATAGDAWLGGEDFDRLLAEAVANAFWRRTQVELRHRVVEWQRLLVGCEQVKCVLSNVDAALLEIPHIVGAPQPMDLEQRIDRSAFERICLPLVRGSLEICGQAFGALGLEPRDVTQLVATGGSTCIPLVQRELEAYFDQSAAASVDPFYAICLGAGLYAARLAGHPVRKVQPKVIEPT